MINFPSRAFTPVAWLPVVLLLTPRCPAADSNSVLRADSPKATSSSAAKSEPFWQKLLRITGVSATPSQMKGDDEDFPGGGRIWLCDLSAAQPRPLTAQSGYRSPVFMPNGISVLAQKTNEIWRIPIDHGPEERVCQIEGLSKLVGFSQDDTNLLCVLVDRQHSLSVELLSLATGKSMPITFDSSDPRDLSTLNNLKAWVRDYGQTRVYTLRQRKTGLLGEFEWNDVFLKRAQGPPVNVSRADGTNCGQPSLDPSGQKVVFIKATEPEGR